MVLEEASAYLDPDNHRRIGEFYRFSSGLSLENFADTILANDDIIKTSLFQNVTVVQNAGRDTFPSQCYIANIDTSGISDTDKRMTVRRGNA